MAKNKTSKSKGKDAAEGLPKAKPVVPVMVVWHPEAVVDFDDQVSDKQTRKRVHTSVDVLVRSGGKAPFPAQSAVSGGEGLRELRCGGGRVPWRPIFSQIDGTELFVIWAFGPEAQVDENGFDEAVRRAKQRRDAATGS
jgi:hypothetical protein